MTTVDLFEDVATADVTSTPEVVDETVAEGTDTPETDKADESDKPEILDTLPDGAMTVSAFAEMLTMREFKSAEGESIRFPYGIVNPQTVYQATKGKNNPIPHALVQLADWPKPQLYILNDGDVAEDYWKGYVDRNRNRGAGTGAAASKRSPEDLKDGYAGAVKDNEYNLARLALWTANVAKSQALLDKYHTWLDGAGVTTDEVTTLADTAKAEFVAEQDKKKADSVARRAAKAAEKVEA